MRAWLVVSCVLASACSSPLDPIDPPIDPPIEISCPVDREPGSPGCAPKRADACAAGRRPSLGQDDCVALGHVCAPGFEPDPSGWGCRAIAAPTCGPGARVALGQADCAPVGWTSCPDGWSAATDRWGCEAIFPRAPCTDGTMAILGQTSCQPIGDCAAPFPPTGATHLVDATFPESSLDATHFRTITAAVAAAFPNAIIAIERGTYRDEGIRVDVPMTFVGRCAAETVLDGAGSVPGFGIVGTTAEISGLRLVGHSPGVLSARGGTARLREVEILDAVGAGVLAINPGSQVTIDSVRIARTTIAGNTPGAGVLLQGGSAATLLDVEIDSSIGVGLGAIESGTTLTATRTIIRNIAMGNGSGDGALVTSGAAMTIHQSVIDGASRLGALAQGGKLELIESEVRRSGLLGVSEPGGVRVVNGGEARLDRVRIAESLQIGAGAYGDGSQLLVTDSVVTQGRVGVDQIALGVVGQAGAAVRIAGSAIVANPNGAIVGYNGASFALSRSRIGAGSQASTTGLLLAGGATMIGDELDLEGRADGAYTVDLRDSGTAGTIADSVIHDGPSAVFDRASLVLLRSSVRDCPEVGFYLGGSVAPPNAGGGRMEISDSVFARNATSEDPGGGGTLMLADASFVRLERSDLVDSFAEGIYVDPSSHLEVVSANILGTKRGVDGSKGMGFEIYGSALIVDSAVVANHGGGVVLRDTGSTTISQSLLAANNLAGVFGDFQSRLLLRDSAIVDSRAVEDPKGAESYGFGALMGGDSIFERTLIRGNRYAGIGFDASRRPNGVTRIEGCVVEQTSADGTAFGHGVLVGAGTIEVRDSWVLDNERVGIAFSHATGLVTKSVIAGNVVGTHVQDGTTLEDAAREPNSLLPLHAIFTNDTVFVANGSRVGIGQIPVPGQPDPELGGPPERRMAQ